MTTPTVAATAAITPVAAAAVAVAPEAVAAAPVIPAAGEDTDSWAYDQFYAGSQAQSDSLIMAGGRGTEVGQSHAALLQYDIISLQGPPCFFPLCVMNTPGVINTPGDMTYINSTVTTRWLKAAGCSLRAGSGCETPHLPLSHNFTVLTVCCSVLWYVQQSEQMPFALGPGHICAG